jgi:hypothetical protein
MAQLVVQAHWEQRARRELKDRQALQDLKGWWAPSARRAPQDLRAQQAPQGRKVQSVQWAQPGLKVLR